MSSEGVEDLGHTVMHWQDSDHHHHEDGTLHADDSNGTVHHMHADGASNAAGILSTHRLHIPQFPSTSPAMATLLPFPSLVPKGLLRPPRTQA
ncbi:hypothetical protein [Polaromonas aquatica]|uniref:hypothetical protein n=1 Tax=Polaromonas aquatica TaxID=332657 RepID=UPI003D6504F1